MKEITKKYSNGEITVVWKPSVCSHSTKCFRGLPQVFDPRKRPWITIEGAESDDVIVQVSQCPSGALSYFYNSRHEDEAGEQPLGSSESVKVEIQPNGPAILHSSALISMEGKEPVERPNRVALCRCGQSQNKPFCDGSHIGSGFIG